MIIAGHSASLKKLQKLVIVPLSDIHHNAPAHDRTKFKECIEWIKRTAARPDRVVLTMLMGDYLDTFSTSERQALRSANLHESSRARIERMLLDDLGALTDDLRPIASTLVGALEGNHTYKFQETESGAHVGKTFGRILAETFGVPFFGVCGFLGLDIKLSGTSTAAFKILMHHGFGTASMKSTSIMQVMKMRERFPACDLYILGHNHVPIATVQQGIDFSRDTRNGGSWRMKQKQQAFIRAASFLKGYVEGEACDYHSGSYVETRGLVPQGLGVVTCNVRWRFKDGTSQTNGLDVHVQE